MRETKKQPFRKVIWRGRFLFAAHPVYVWNACKAIYRKAKAFVLRQPILVDERTQTKRSCICRRCVYKLGAQCTECGCVISAKIYFVDEFCPRGKW